MTPSNPRLWAAMDAHAIVLTLLGASGHSPLTGPATRVHLVGVLTRKNYAVFLQLPCHRQADNVTQLTVNC